MSLDFNLSANIYTYMYVFLMELAVRTDRWIKRASERERGGGWEGPVVIE